MGEYMCGNCLFSNFNEDGSVMCDKRLLSDGKEILVQVDNVDLNCPAHSEYPTEEFRYLRNNKLLRDADDACEVCGRILNMRDEDTYDYAVIGNEGSVVRKCIICIDKGR